MKRIFRVCNVLWLMAASQLAVQVQAKTVAWYRFDESAPGVRTTSQSVITNFADSSALSGSPMVAAMPYGGKQKTAYEPEDRMPSYVEAYPSSLSVFDPISGISHLNAAALFCSNTAATAFTPASIVLVEDDERLHLDSMTIECFLKVPPVPAGSTWLSVLTRDYDASGKLAYGLRLMATGHLAFYVTTKDESGAATQTQYAYNKSWHPAIDDDKWHHVAVTYNADTRKCALYLDYELALTGDYDGTLYTEDIVAPLQIGAQVNSYYGGFRGSIDELRISDVALVPEQFLRCVPTASPMADENTLVYVNFEAEDALPSAFDAIGPTGASAFWNKAPARAAYLTDPFVNCGDATGISPARESDVPSQSLRRRLGEVSAVGNMSAMHFSTNASCEHIAGRFEVPDPNGYVFSDSCTVEFFFKIPEGAFSMPTRGASFLFCREGSVCVAASSEGDFKEHFRLRIYDNGASEATYLEFPDSVWFGKHASAKAYNDDRWHHFALTYDAETKEAVCFVDHRQIGSGQNMQFQPKTSRYCSSLCFVGDFWGVNVSDTPMQIADSRLDEIRITRGVLKPYQFMSDYPSEEPLLAYGSFEGSLTLAPYIGFYSDGIASAFVAGSEAPGFSSAVPRRRIRDNQNAEPRANAQSVSFAGGKVSFGARELIAEAKEYTVEFFIKTESSVSGMGVVRMGDVGGWRVHLTDAVGNLDVAVDTDAKAEQHHTFDCPLGDGLWHHVALVFNVVDGNSCIKAYRDHELSGVWTANGKVAPSVGSELQLGVSDDVSVGFIGCIDELRVMRGELSPDQFMDIVPTGLLLMVR